MSDLAANVKTCMACRGGAAGCNGPCPCPADGRDVSAHAVAGDCPRGHFSGVPVPPVKLSTSRGASFELPGDEASVEAARQTARRGGCCGQPKA